MMKLALVAIFAALMLIMVPVTAFAAPTYGTAALVVYLVDLNGAKTGFLDSEAATPFAIVNDKNLTQVKDIEVKVRVLTPTSSDKITGVLSASPVAKVLKRDGTYADVTLRDVIKAPVQSGPAIQWYLYQAKISVSDLENIIGTGPAFKSELRISTKSSVNYQGTIAGKTGIFFTPQMLVTIPISKTGGTAPTTINTPAPPVYNPPTIGTDSNAVSDQQPISAVPTGRVYHTVYVKYTDGQTRILTTGNLAQFSAISIPGDNPAGSNVIESIRYVMRAVIDNDDFNVPPTLAFSNHLSQENFGAYIVDESVKKTWTDRIQRIGGQYQLLEMEVKASDLAGLIDNEVGTNSGLFTQKLTFKVRESTLNLSVPGKTFPIKIPEQKVVIDLQKQEIVEQTGGDINGETFTPTGSLDMNIIIAVVGIAAAVGIIGVASKKKIRR